MSLCVSPSACGPTLTSRHLPTRPVFCTDCSKFLADRFIEGTCPKCGFEDARGDQCDNCSNMLSAVELIDPRCKTDKTHKTEVRSTRHLFLDLPALQPKLSAWFEKSSVEGGWSNNASAITRSWLAAKGGLQRRCITRDLKWGTPVPHPKFTDKVFYVWFDAPIGYISITANYSPEHWKEWWHNPDNVELVQFMGKDNVPFHTVVFPSSLIGGSTNWTLLNRLSTTEYLNYEGGKFSKSRNMGVFGDHPKHTSIPSEVWRYYLLATRPESSDAMFRFGDLADRNNNELLANVGNFINRALKFPERRFDNAVPGVGTVGATEAALTETVDKLLAQYNEAMEALRLKDALSAAMAVSAAGNQYLQSCKPWEQFKADPEACKTTVTYGLQMAWVLAVLLEPFMPGFSEKVCHQLNLDHLEHIPDKFTITIPTGHKLGTAMPIFREILAPEVDQYRKRFGTAEAGAGAGAGAGAASASASVSASASASASASKQKGGKQTKGGPKAKGGAKNAPKDPNDISRIDLRVGRIVRAWPHPDADRLWCEEVDLGEGAPREIASGLRDHYTQEEMTGRRICVVANLKPVKMVGLCFLGLLCWISSFVYVCVNHLCCVACFQRGFLSNGMVLCAKASVDGKDVVEFVDPPADAPPGTRLSVAGYDSEPDAVVTARKKNSPWDACAVVRRCLCG